MKIELINGASSEAFIFREQMIGLLQCLLNKTASFNEELQIEQSLNLKASPMSSPQDILDEHFNNDGLALICYSEQDLFGVALVKFEASCFINKLVVGERGLGIGSKLMKEIVSQAQKFGSTSLTLDAHSSNIDALKFYRKHDMKVLAHRLILEV